MWSNENRTDEETRLKFCLLSSAVSLVSGLSVIFINGGVGERLGDIMEHVEANDLLVAGN